MVNATTMDITLDHLEGESKLLEEEIRKYETMIEEEPKRLLEELEKERCMMPPPDDLEEREREKDFYDKLSRGQLYNERRYKARNTTLILLIVAATIAVVCWVYNSLVSSGIFGQ